MKSNYSLILFVTVFSATVVTSGYAENSHTTATGRFQQTGEKNSQNIHERNAVGSAVALMGTCQESPRFKLGNSDLTYNLKAPIFSSMRSFIEKYINQANNVTVETTMEEPDFRNLFAQAFGQVKAEGKTYYESINDKDKELKEVINALSKAYAVGMNAAFEAVKDSSARAKTKAAIEKAKLKNDKRDRDSDKAYLTAIGINKAVDGNKAENVIALEAVEGKIHTWLKGCNKDSVTAGISAIKSQSPATSEENNLSNLAKADKKLAAAIDLDNTSQENKDKINNLIAKRDEVLNNQSSNQADKDKATREFRKKVEKLPVGGKVKDELFRATSHEKQANVLLGTKKEPGAIKVSKDGFSKKLASLKTTNEADNLAKELKDKKAELVDTLTGVNSEIKNLNAKSGLSPDESSLLKRLKAKKVRLEEELDSKKSGSFASFESDAQQRIKALRGSLGSSNDPFSIKDKPFQDTKDKLNPFFVHADNERRLETANSEFNNAKNDLIAEADADGSGDVSDAEAYEYLKTNPDTIQDSKALEKFNELKRTIHNKGVAAVFLSESNEKLKDLNMQGDEMSRNLESARSVLSNKDSIRKNYEDKRATIEKREAEITELENVNSAKKLILKGLEKKQKEDVFADLDDVISDAKKDIAVSSARLKREQKLLDAMKRNNDPAQIAVSQIEELTKPSQKVALLSENVANSKVSVNDVKLLSIHDLQRVLNLWENQKKSIVYPEDSDMDTKDALDERVNKNIKLLQEEIARKKLILQSLQD